MVCFIDKYNILYVNQFGFREKHSRMHATLLITDKIQRAVKARWPTRTKLAALYSATKSLQNSCTAKLQLFSSLLEAKQQLHSSCSGMQKRCAAFEGSLKLSAAVLQRSCRLSNAAK